MFLYPRNTSPSMTPYTQVSTLMPQEMLNHAIHNYTPLTAYVFGLIAGKSRHNLSKTTGTNYQDYQSQYLAVAAAADIIIRCTARYPSHFQLMIGNQIVMQPVSTFRLAPSRTGSD